VFYFQSGSDVQPPVQDLEVRDDAEEQSEFCGGAAHDAARSAVLPMGRFLRMTKINELPQLINILKGDMSSWARARGGQDIRSLSRRVKRAIYNVRRG
jgi:lipopolysaccharide/colanic/teichoic acid biosynthesis glycosyltransferase